jgi:hypothetical protein
MLRLMAFAVGLTIKITATRTDNNNASFFLIVINESNHYRRTVGFFHR